MTPILLHPWQIKSLQRGASAVVVPMKPQPVSDGVCTYYFYTPNHGAGCVEPPCESWLEHCPFAVGEVLWVRESWRCVNWPGEDYDFREIIQYRDGTCREIGHEGDHTLEFENWCEKMAWEGARDLEKAGWKFDDFGRLENEEEYPHEDPPIRWRPPQHMPRWASRYSLTVTAPPAARRYDQLTVDQKIQAGFSVEFWEASYPSRPWLWYLPVEPLKGE